MRGQVWPEYLLMAAAIILIGVSGLLSVMREVSDASICAAAHMAALAEITRQEQVYGKDYTLYGLICANYIEVRCSCADEDAVKKAVEEVADRSVRVR